MDHINSNIYNKSFFAKTVSNKNQQKTNKLKIEWKHWRVCLAFKLDFTHFTGSMT